LHKDECGAIARSLINKRLIHRETLLAAKYFGGTLASSSPLKKKKKKIERSHPDISALLVW
jgi:hypothetical protein